MYIQVPDLYWYAILYGFAENDIRLQKLPHAAFTSSSSPNYFYHSALWFPGSDGRVNPTPSHHLFVRTVCKFHCESRSSCLVFLGWVVYWRSFSPLVQVELAQIVKAPTNQQLHQKPVNLRKHWNEAPLTNRRKKVEKLRKMPWGKQTLLKKISLKSLQKMVSHLRL